MEKEIKDLCDRLDTIRDEQSLLRTRLDELNRESMSLDADLNRILHASIDPLLKGHWHARIVLYKDGQRG